MPLSALIRKGVRKQLPSSNIAYSLRGNEFMVETFLFFTLPAEEDGIQRPGEVDAEENGDDDISKHVQSKRHASNSASGLQDNQECNLKKVVECSDDGPDLSNIKEEVSDNSNQGSINIELNELVDLGRGLLVAGGEGDKACQGAGGLASGTTGNI